MCFCALQAILDVVVNLQFGLIEKLWQTFWRYSPSVSVEGATVTENRQAPPTPKAGAAF